MQTSKALPTSFEELIANSDKPVLVDFYADWCGPCKVVSPIVQQIARDYKGQLLTVKINIDKKQRLAAKYRVTAVPTLMLFSRGSLKETLQGARGYEEIARIVETHLT